MKMVGPFIHFTTRVFSFKIDIPKAPPLGLVLQKVSFSCFLFITILLYFHSFIMIDMIKSSVRMVSMNHYHGKKLKFVLLKILNMFSYPYFRLECHYHIQTRDHHSTHCQKRNYGKIVSFSYLKKLN